MDKTKTPMWLIWIQNKENGEYSSFNEWGKDADEAIKRVADNFFDAPLVNVAVDADGNFSEVQTASKPQFESKKLRVVSIKKFEPGDVAGLCEARERDGKGRFRNW